MAATRIAQIKTVMYLTNAGWGRQSLLPTAHSLLAARISLIGKLKFLLFLSREFLHNFLNWKEKMWHSGLLGDHFSLKFPVFSLFPGNVDMETGSRLTASSATQFGLGCVFSLERESVDIPAA